MHRTISRAPSWGLAALLGGCLLNGSAVQAQSGQPQSSTRTSHSAGISKDLNLIVTGPDNILLAIQRVGFDETSIQLGITLTNRSIHSIGMNADGSLHLRDDKGNRYPVEAPSKNTQLNVGAGGQMIADLRFKGPVLPEATTLSLEMNTTAMASTTIGAAAPRISLTGIEVPQEARDAASKQDQAVPSEAMKFGAEGKDRSGQLRVFHPSGIDFGLRRLGFEADSIVVGVTIKNQSNAEVELAGRGPMLLVDDLGNQHKMVMVHDDPKLTLKPDETYDAELTFMGSLDPKAKLLKLLVNQTPSAAAPETPNQPVLEISGIPATDWKAMESGTKTTEAGQ